MPCPFYPSYFSNLFSVSNVLLHTVIYHISGVYFFYTALKFLAKKLLSEEEKEEATFIGDFALRSSDTFDCDFHHCLETLTKR